MLGERIKLARKKSGHSLRSLASAIDHKVSAMALSKYERDEMTPGSDVLLALSHALDVSVASLVDSQGLELQEVDFRKKVRTTKRERAKVEAAALDWVERYIQIERILELDRVNWERPFRKRAIRSLDAAEKAAEDLREAWKLGWDPIPNVTELLEAQGLKVLLEELPDNVSGLTCTVSGPGTERPIPLIVINRTFSLERRRLTLAHELGHQLIDARHLDAKASERATNRFAGAFLIPRTHLESEVGSRRNALGYREILALKRVYRVSAAALLIRLRDIGVIDDGVLSTAFQTYARSWRTNEPDSLERPGEEGQGEPVRRFERLCYRALAEQFISLAKASELLKKPIEEIERGLKGSRVTSAGHRQ